ncbi:S-type anion channel SLAH4 [Spinacia oleracea]|uniref:S-type anion channel SLAH4 n=1 Tax=Spinacia oleracea TaxID=3562 RepID=A0ABM3QRW1_SPIOL|nr:S-type anion channel SLAH4-like [Spinacia oleracea]
MEPKSSSKSVVEIVIEQPKLANNDLIITATNNKSRERVSIFEHFVKVILVRFHAGYFRVSFSLCAQALLWKTLVQFIKDNHHLYYHHHLVDMLPSIACTLLWSVALGMLISLSFLYALRCFYHFDKVKREFLHHVGVNYLFAPSMSCLLLLQTSPFTLPRRDSIYMQLLWWVFVVPIIMLDIKIYGQWLTKGKRLLSRVANPTCQLSIIANLIAAKDAIDMGWLEIALCLFSLAMIHYLVLFITLYQRLPGSNGVSMMLRPVFFLFIATPSMASLAWGSINGSFDDASKMLFFLSVFLFMSLVSRPTLFEKSMRKFNIAWWAYSFPMTILALASIEYAQQVKNGVAHTLALVISSLSILVTFALMVLTTFNINKLFFRDQPTTITT